MTGISKATGQMTQARTSYLSREIMWGHRFLNIITYDKTNENYIAHIDKLDEIQQVKLGIELKKQLLIYSLIYAFKY